MYSRNVDAPALVTTDVGIAVGAGIDVAIESVDIILVRSDPRDEPEAAYSKIDCEGRVAYFCSKQCEEEFKKNPKNYLSKIKK